jgi:hypothetical protein
MSAEDSSRMRLLEKTLNIRAPIALLELVRKTIENGSSGKTATLVVCQNYLNTDAVYLQKAQQIMDESCKIYYLPPHRDASPSATLRYVRRNLESDQL